MGENKNPERTIGGHQYMHAFCSKRGPCERRVRTFIFFVIETTHQLMLVSYFKNDLKVSLLFEYRCGIEGCLRI